MLNLFWFVFALKSICLGILRQRSYFLPVLFGVNTVIKAIYIADFIFQNRLGISIISKKNFATIYKVGEMTLDDNNSTKLR